MKKITVLLIDDHEMVRDGLATLFQSLNDIEVVGCFGDGLEGLKQVEDLEPDVVVVDVTLPGLSGIEITRSITTRTPHSRVCALTMHCEGRIVRDMISAGASGYVVKSAPVVTIIEAIRAIGAGTSFFSDEVMEFILPGRQPETEGGPDPIGRLTPRERQVLQLIAEGSSSKRAAAILNVTKKTIDHHRQRLMQKLRLYSVAELTKFAIRSGLTPIDGEKREE